MKFTFIDKKLPYPTLSTSMQKRSVNLTLLCRMRNFVTYEIERGRHKVELTVRSSGLYFRVSETTNDMYASIDSAVAAIEKQIHRNKTRLEKKLRSGAFAKDAVPASGYYTEDEDEEEFKIIRTKTFSMKPMPPEEAVLQMNLLEHDFYAFRNSANEDSPSSIAEKTAITDLSILTTPDPCTRDSCAVRSRLPRRPCLTARSPSDA